MEQKGKARCSGDNLPQGKKHVVSSLSPQFPVWRIYASEYRGTANLYQEISINLEQNQSVNNSLRKLLDHRAKSNYTIKSDGRLSLEFQVVVIRVDVGDFCYKVKRIVIFCSGNNFIKEQRKQCLQFQTEA